MPHPVALPPLQARILLPRPERDGAVLKYEAWDADISKAAHRGELLSCVTQAHEFLQSAHVAAYVNNLITAVAFRLLLDRCAVRAGAHYINLYHTFVRLVYMIWFCWVAGNFSSSGAFPFHGCKFTQKKDSSAKFMVKMYYFSVSKRVKISCLGTDKMESVACMVFPE